MHNEAAKIAIAKGLGYDSIEQAFIEIYHKNQSCKLIAEKFGISQATAKYHLKKLGVKLKKNSNNYVSNETIREVVKKHGTQIKAAEVLGFRVGPR